MQSWSPRSNGSNVTFVDTSSVKLKIDPEATSTRKDGELFAFDSFSDITVEDSSEGTSSAVDGPISPIVRIEDPHKDCEPKITRKSYLTEITNKDGRCVRAQLLPYEWHIHHQTMDVVRNIDAALKEWEFPHTVLKKIAEFAVEFKGGFELRHSTYKYYLAQSSTPWHIQFSKFSSHKQSIETPDVCFVVTNFTTVSRNKVRFKILRKSDEMEIGVTSEINQFIQTSINHSLVRYGKLNTWTYYGGRNGSTFRSGSSLDPAQILDGPSGSLHFPGGAMHALEPYGSSVRGQISTVDILVDMKEGIFQCWNDGVVQCRECVGFREVTDELVWFVMLDDASDLVEIEVLE